MFDFLFQYDFSAIFTFQAIIGIIIGSVLGMIVGALPGLGSPVGCALLIPMTFTMEPSAAICMLVSLFMASCYGGSISSVLLGIPGTPAAVATVLDGAPIARQGKPGLALGYSLYASTIGGFFGCLILMLMTGALARFAVRLSDPELLLIGIVGLISCASLGEADPWKCFISLIMGLMVGVVGLDQFTGSPRYTFGNIFLGDGISLVALLTGLFVIPEIIEMCMGNMAANTVSDTRNLKCRLTMSQFKSIVQISVRSSIIGTIFGIVPGLGASAATFFAYTQAKRVDKEPDTFGKGNPRGLAAAESANNAVVGGGLVPFLSLGIPGSPTVAVIAGALMLQGITPGPTLFRDNPELVYTIYWGVFLSTIVMFIFGRYTTSMFARVLLCPNYVLIPVISVLLMIGSFAARSFAIDIWTALIAGTLAFLLKKLDFSITAFTLAFVLAHLIEIRFRRSLMLSQGSFSIFFTRPLCLVLWVLVIYMTYASIKNARQAAAIRKGKAS